MIILKAENGNIELLDDDGNAYEVLPPQAHLKKDAARGEIQVIYAQNNIVSIPLSAVEFTQIAPASAVAFTGTLQDLFDSLKNSFFFNLEEGSFEFPDYPIGSYQSFSETFGGVSNVAALTNRVYGQVVKVYKRVELNLISIFIAGAGVVGNAVFGIYKYTDNGTDVGQWDLVEQTDQSTPFNTAVGGLQQVLLTNNAILEPGIYCMCTLSSSAFSITSQNLSTGTTFMGWNTAGGTTSYQNGITNAFTYNPIMPAQLTLAAKINLATTPIITAKVV